MNLALWSVSETLSVSAITIAIDGGIFIFCEELEECAACARACA